MCIVKMHIYPCGHKVEPLEPLLRCPESYLGIEPSHLVLYCRPARTLSLILKDDFECPRCLEFEQGLPGDPDTWHLFSLGASEQQALNNTLQGTAVFGLRIQESRRTITLAFNTQRNFVFPVGSGLAGRFFEALLVGMSMAIEEKATTVLAELLLEVVERQAEIGEPDPDPLGD